MDRAVHPFVALVMLVLTLVSCGDGTSESAHANDKAKIVSFTSPEETWGSNIAEVVATFEGRVYYQIVLDGEIVSEGNHDSIMPLMVWIKGLDSNRGYTPIINVWRNEPQDIKAVPVEDSKAASLRTRPSDYVSPEKPKIVSFEAPFELVSVNAAELVLVVDQDIEYYVVDFEKPDGTTQAVIGRPIPALWPESVKIKQLESEMGYVAKVGIYKKMPALKTDMPDDMAFVTFKTLGAPADPMPTPLTVTNFAVEAFGSGSAKATFTSNKVGYYQLERYLPGQGWQYIAGDNTRDPNQSAELYFDTRPGEYSQLRIMMSVNNGSETAVSNTVNYTAPAAELVIADVAYGTDVMSFSWQVATADLSGNVVDLEAYCGRGDPGYDRYWSSLLSEVYGNQVFVEFSVYDTINPSVRCYLVGRDKRTLHRLRSNYLPMMKLFGSAISLEVLAVNATDAQFRVTADGRTLSSPTVFCNTENNDYNSFPFVELWRQNYQTQGVGIVRELLPDRRHYCWISAKDARTGMMVVVRPQFITTRSTTNISFGSWTVDSSFDPKFVETTFSWNTSVAVNSVRLSCTCDKPGLLGCNTPFSVSARGKAGQFTLTLARSTYYTCVGSATAAVTGDVLRDGEYSFLAVPDP